MPRALKTTYCRCHTAYSSRDAPLRCPFCFSRTEANINVIFLSCKSLINKKLNRKRQKWGEECDGSLQQPSHQTSEKWGNSFFRKLGKINLLFTQYARGTGNNGDIFSRNGACLPELLILDEAHSARVSKDISGSSKKTQIYAMLERVSGKIPHMILATATPMQKEAGEYHSLLKLLGLPKAWQKSPAYMKSLDLISCSEFPSLTDLSSAAKMLNMTMEGMKPSIDRLNEEQNRVLNRVIELKDGDVTILTDYVRDNWSTIRQLLVLLHPAHLLTVRNTRRSLSEKGYKFPTRKLTPVSIPDSMEIEMFYDHVNSYLSKRCFSIEEVLFPDRKISIGFVRVSYQQRVASSLYSCKKSLERRLEKIPEEVPRTISQRQ